MQANCRGSQARLTDGSEIAAGKKGLRCSYLMRWAENVLVGRFHLSTQESFPIFRLAWMVRAVKGAPVTASLTWGMSWPLQHVMENTQPFTPLQTYTQSGVCWKMRLLTFFSYENRFRVLIILSIFRIDLRKNSFPERVVNNLNIVPMKVVKSPTLEVKGLHTWPLGPWFSGGLVSVRLMVGLDDLQGPPQTPILLWFCVSTETSSLTARAQEMVNQTFTFNIQLLHGCKLSMLDFMFSVSFSMIAEIFSLTLLMLKKRSTFCSLFCCNIKKFV